MMLYLLDANVLIDANRDYYPISRIPEFWDWLVHMGLTSKVKVPIEIYDEVKEGSDELALWIKEKGVKDALLLNREADPALVSRAVEVGYAPDLSDDEVLKLGRDPFLLGYALIEPDSHCVVTTEVSKPSKQRANRHLPDAADVLGIQRCNTFQLTQSLDFRTSWHS